MARYTLVYGVRLVPEGSVRALDDAKLTLAVFLFLPILAVFSLYFNKRLYVAFKRSRERIGDVNAQVEDTLFTLKEATECESAGHRFVDRETRERAMMIMAGPMEDDMRGLLSGCGDFVGGFVRASDDSDFDFYTVNGGAVARKVGCDLAR